jgi:hypothetical protein
MLRKFRSSLVACGLLFAALCGLAVVPTNAKDEKNSSPKTESQDKPGVKKLAMKAFMRKKLASSQDIIEGLALEDFDLIEKGAKQLKAMSAAAEVMASNDPIYREHADDFRRVVTKMEKAAREKRIDGATLGFMDMTMNCVECHKYVRTILIAQ